MIEWFYALSARHQATVLTVLVLLIYAVAELSIRLKERQQRRIKQRLRKQQAALLARMRQEQDDDQQGGST